MRIRVYFESGAYFDVQLPQDAASHGAVTALRTDTAEDPRDGDSDSYYSATPSDRATVRPNG